MRYRLIRAQSPLTETPASRPRTTRIRTQHRSPSRHTIDYKPWLCPRCPALSPIVLLSTLLMRVGACDRIHPGTLAHGPCGATDPLRTQASRRTTPAGGSRSRREFSRRATVCATSSLRPVGAGRPAAVARQLYRQPLAHEPCAPKLTCMSQKQDSGPAQSPPSAEAACTNGAAA